MPTLKDLADRQNRDGGWGYHRGGSSWTEPTSYALLALASDGLAGGGGVRRGLSWLASQQRADGGWAPRAGVEESTWVTAMALLLPTELAGGADRNRGAAWLLAQTGRESGFVYRLRMRLLGVRTDTDQQFEGWPWYPGTAAWVAPTALSILAMEKLGRRSGDARLGERIAQGRAFLMARRCRDGGWNHGSTRALGYDSDSYPETTGVALLALHGSKAPGMMGAVAAAERHLAQCKSPEAASWLTLALLAQGRQPSQLELATHGGTVELALAALAQAARNGRNLLLDAS